MAALYDFEPGDPVDFEPDNLGDFESDLESYLNSEHSDSISEF